MNKKGPVDIKKFWNNTASDWEIQVGIEGDSNRRLNSDPILWKFAGDIRGLKVLDAGCGTGYLSKQLSDKGGIVTGIDISDAMVEIAKKNNPESIFNIDSCATLETLNAADFDLIISNYVLMDTPELRSSMKAFNRVLKLHGTAILIFSHPCFPQGRAVVKENEIQYCWNFPYFEESTQIDKPWGHFKERFIWIHRPLSQYWKEFKNSGFDIIDFDEPVIAEEKYHQAADEKLLNDFKRRPYSVAFKIIKVRQC